MPLIQLGPVCRMDFVPEKSALEVDEIHVNKQTRELLTFFGKGDLPGVDRGPVAIASAAEEAALLAVAQQQAEQEAEISGRLPREVLNIKRRMELQQSSLDALQGTMSDLSAMVAQIALSLKPTAEIPNSTPTSQHQFATPPPPPPHLSPIPEVTTPSASSTHPSLTPQKPKPFTPPISANGSLAEASHSTNSVAFSTQNTSQTNAAPARVAPLVFGEMPTPISWQGTHGNINLSEQNVDGIPQAYGFHNLNRHSVFLADGSENSYFALPENYPLEQAVPVPVFDVYADDTDGCSSKYVDVLADTPGQQIYEEEPQRGEPLKCLSKALETEHTSACVNIISDVRDFTLELRQQDDERSSDGPFLKNSNSHVPRSSQLSIVHSPRELRLLWDPGEHTIRSSTRNKDIVGVLQTSILTQDASNHIRKCNLKYLLQSYSHPPILKYSFMPRYCGVKCNWWLNTVLQSMSDQVEVMNPLSLNTPWDPGVLVMHSGFTQNSTRTTGDAQWLKFSSPTSCELPLSSSVKGSTFQVINNYLNVMFSMRMVQNTLQSLRYMSAIVNRSLSNLAILVLSASCREITEDCFANQELMANTASRVAALTWYNSLTGATFIQLSIITYTWEIDIYTVSCQVQFSQLIAEHLLSLTACKQYIAPNDVTSVLHAICFTLQRAAHLIQDNYLSSLYCKNLAALRNQSVGSGACYIWDPGTMLLWYKCKWWLLYTEENINWLAETKCYGVALWLIHFQPP